jgi:hypothetical protein
MGQFCTIGGGAFYQFQKETVFFGELMKHPTPNPDFLGVVICI